MSRKGVSSFSGKRVGLIAAAHGAHDTFSAFLPPLLPKLIEMLSITKAEAGLLVVFIRVPALAQPLIGHLADKRGLKTLVILAPMVTACAMCFLGLATSYAAAALLLVLAGASSACLHSVAPALIGAMSGRYLGRGMSFWMVGGEFGRFLGPIVIVGAVSWLTLKGLPVLIVMGVLTSLALRYALRNSPSSDNTVARRTPLRKGGLIARLRKLRSIFLPLALFIGFRAIVHTAFTVFLPTFLIERGHGLGFAGISLSVLEGAGVLGALSGGTFSDAVGRRRVLFGGMGVAALATFLFILSEQWLSQLFILFVIGYALLSSGPVLMALVQEHYPDNRALANAVYMTLGFVISSAAAFGVGLIGDACGLRIAFIIGAVSLLMCLPISLAFPGKKR